MEYLNVCRYQHKSLQFQKLSLSTQVRSCRRIVQMASGLPFVYRLNVQFLVVLIVTFKLPSCILNSHYLVFWYCFFAASMKPANNGCPSRGELVNSGWNCTA